MNSTALACTTLLGLLLFFLGLSVSILRTRASVISGYSSDPDQLLTRLIRAHGNTAEYGAFFAVPFFVPWLPASASLAALVHGGRKLRAACSSWSRYLHGRQCRSPNPARAIGALGTYAFGVALCVGLLSIH